MRGNKPVAFASRAIVALVAVAFARLEHNPLVRFEALVGLSPAPLERFFGIKGAFSGMTEGTFRLAHGDFQQAIAANVFTPVIALLLGAWLFTGYLPRIQKRSHEVLCFATLLVMTICNNLLS